MRVHSNATTTPKQRDAIQASSAGLRPLARAFHVSPTTVRRWRHRRTVDDRSCRPQTIHYAVTTEEAGLLLRLRQQYQLSLDAVLDAIEGLLPHIGRSAIYRVFKRAGVHRLPPRAQQATSQPGVFKDYAPGFLHIALFYLPKLDGQARYCFVAVDRATRLVFLHVYAHKDKAAATDFLQRCLAIFPFRIETILTDNGGEFTPERFCKKYGPAKTAHPVDVLCAAQRTEHRRTRPYTPKTNGLVERTNGLIKADTTKRHTYTTAPEMLTDLDTWLVTYNTCRRHRRLGRKPPYAVLCEWYWREPERFLREPTHFLTEIHRCAQSGET